MRTRRALICLGSTFAIACAPSGDDGAAAGTTAAAPASAASESSPSGNQLAELTDFRLTKDKLDRYFTASHNVLDRMAQMPPAERERLKTAMDREDENATMEDLIREFDARPVLAGGIRSAGISTRDFVSTMMALLQGGMGVLYLESQPRANADSLARELGTHPANFQFVREHRAEIERRQKEVDEKQRKLDGEG